MQDDESWPEPEPKKQAFSFESLLLPLLAFAIGGALVFAMTAGPRQAIVAPPPGVSTFGNAGQQPSAAITPPGAAEELDLMREINDGFVSTLRDYHGRLREIADVAEVEGAATAAESLRDFALETEQIIERYDQITEASR